MSDDNDVSVDSRSEQDLDQLADTPKGPSNSFERPMNDEEASKQERHKEKSAPSSDSYEFNHNGKPIKATREQMIKWAQMGYDRPQVMQKINQEKQALQDQQTKLQKEFEAKYGLYQQIDNYAAQNKDWWNHIQSSYQNRANPVGSQQGQQAQPVIAPSGQLSPELQPYLSKIESLEQKLSQFEPVVNSIVEQNQALKVKEEDAKLETEIQSMREKHSDLDWTSIDENGKSLEQMILEHAQTTGIPTFRAAMRDLLHDELVNRVASRAKQAVSKGIQAKTRQGVLGESPTSRLGLPMNRTKNIRDTSYEDLQNEIFEELRMKRS